MTCDGLECARERLMGNDDLMWSSVDRAGGRAEKARRRYPSKSLFSLFLGAFWSALDATVCAFVVTKTFRSADIAEHPSILVIINPKSIVTRTAMTRPQTPIPVSTSRSLSALCTLLATGALLLSFPEHDEDGREHALSFPRRVLRTGFWSVSEQDRRAVSAGRKTDDDERD
jgi:hypothetical protein